MTKSSFRSAFPLLLVSCLSAGCAEERPPINRVQANALDKEFFVGKVGEPGDDPEFYFRNFVVDASESQSLIGIGSWSGVDRIRWEITERYLYARRAYPQNPGADDKGDTGGVPDGTLVAAYPIESHFDIVRDYNPSTGEELNVVEENSSDRPWYERRHFRVDWSKNEVDTPLWFDMFAGKVFGNLTVTPLAYYVGDGNHPDAPHFVPKEGYFDITSKFWVEPEPQDPSNPNVPACALIGQVTGNAIDNCDPQEATIRTSYWKVSAVDPDEDFEPFENSRATLDIVGNPGGIGDAFSTGIVTPPRIEWDPQYGYTDANFRRFMHVHNIWEQSHQTTGSCSKNSDCGGDARCLPSGACTVPCNYDLRFDGDNNGTDDQCENAITGYEGSLGSQCSARNRCTLPLRDREVRPIAFWMNKETPAELTDPIDEDGQPVGPGPTEDIAYSWNQLLQQSVAKAREVECRRTAEDKDPAARESCHEEFFVPDEIAMVSYGGWGIEQVRDTTDVLVVCHNPVRSYDHPICGKEGYSARVGDLRHNFLFYWPYSSRAPWGGIANWNGDPLTGRILGASATTMGRSATFSAAMTRDLIMLANGELSIADVTQGTTAYLYERELRDGRIPEALTEEQIETRVAAIQGDNVLETLGVPAGSSSTLPQLRQFEAKANTLLDVMGTQHLEFEAAADKLRGSIFEAQMIDPSQLVDVGLPPNTDLGDDVLDVASPLRGFDSYRLAAAERKAQLGMTARGICFTDSEVANIGNHDVQGVARFFAEKYSNENLLDNPEVASAAASFTGGTRDQYLSRVRADRIYEELWKETYKGIQLHEMGHALGMLHQFASSYDSTNYQPQYWQLRTQEGEALRSCEGEPRTGNTYAHEDDDCMGPRYLDPETDDELGRTLEEPRPGINYFASTSTMEYQNERFFETSGLGTYDQHAMNALYGRVLQTFDPDDDGGLSKGEQLPFSYRHYSQLIEDQLMVNADATGNVNPTDSFRTPHYTEAARMMKLYRGQHCRPATEDEKAHAQWRIVHGKVCTPPPKDYAHWDDFSNFSPPLLVQSEAGTYDATLYAPRVSVVDGRVGSGNIRWPYRWGQSSNAYAHINTSDAGADIYELTVETIRKFDYSYPFSYFRRSRRDWYYWGTPARTASLFFERLRSYHWGTVSAVSYLRSQGSERYEEGIRDDDDTRPAVLAAHEMFKALARALLMPQIGRYYQNYDLVQTEGTRGLWDTDYPDEDDPNANSSPLFELDAATARFINPAFDFGPAGGGSWDYLSWVSRTGFGTEKVDAVRTLVDGRSAFFTNSRENYLDGRNITVSFRSDLPKAVDRLLGGILAKDWEAVAPYVERGSYYPELELLDLTADEPSRPPEGDAEILFPNLSYRQQVGALVWGHIFSRMSADLGLANKLRIYVDGLEDLDLADDQQIRYTDPESGFTYIARRYGTETIDGREVEMGIGSRMLERANLLLADAFEVELDGEGELLLDAYGRPTLVLEDGQPVRKADDKQEHINRLRNYVNLLDAAVEINRLAGYGPLGL